MKDDSGRVFYFIVKYVLSMPRKGRWLPKQPRGSARVPPAELFVFMRKAQNRFLAKPLSGRIVLWPEEGAVVKGNDAAARKGLLYEKKIMNKRSKILLTIKQGQKRKFKISQ